MAQPQPKPTDRVADELPKPTETSVAAPLDRSLESLEVVNQVEMGRRIMRKRDAVLTALAK